MTDFTPVRRRNGSLFLLRLRAAGIGPLRSPSLMAFVSVIG